MACRQYIWNGGLPGAYYTGRMTTQTAARWTVLGALFLIPFLSLFISNSLFFPFITGKNFWFRILVEIALVGWVVLALADRRYRPRRSTILFAFAGFVAWVGIADLLAMNPHKAFWSNYERMEGWVGLAHVFALFLVAGATLSVEKLWRRWWLTFLTASAVVAGYGILQMLGAAQTLQSATRIEATFGNAIYLAIFSFFAFAISLWQAHLSKGWLRYALLALAAVHVLLILGSGTRGVFVGLIAAAGLGSLLWTATAQGSARKLGIGVLAGVAVLLGGLFALRDTAFIQESPNLARFANISLSDLGTRSAIWGLAVEGIQERPLFGWGQEGFNYVFNTYYDPSLYAQEPWFDRAHNVYLDWAIAGGIPALLLFLLVLLSGVYALARAEGIDRVGKIVLVSALAGYAVQALVVFDNLFSYVPLAMILAYAHAHRAKPIAALEGAREVGQQRLDTIVAPAAAAIAVLLVWTVNIPGMRSAAFLIDGLSPRLAASERLAALESADNANGFATQELAEQAVQLALRTFQDPAASEEVQVATATFATEKLAEEIARAPKDARLRLQYAVLLRGIGNLEDAKVQADAARELSPRKQDIILEQGVQAIARKDYAAAETYFEEAYALDTRNQTPSVYIAAARIYQRDNLGAQVALLESYGTTTVPNMLLIGAYYQNRDWDNVVALLRARYAQSNDPANGFQVVAALAEAGRIAEARTETQRVMADFASDPSVQAQGVAVLEQLSQPMRR